MPPFAVSRPRVPGLLLRTGLAAAAVAALWSPQPAAAYEPFTTANCTALSFSAPPRVVVHTDELPNGPEYFMDNLEMLAAVNEVADDFNRYVTASTAEITSVTTSTEPFVQGDYYGDDPVPTIHIGFRNTGGLASGGPGPSVNCEYDEAHIGIKNLDLYSWQYGLPEDGGQEYYDSLMDDDSSKRYFRLVVLHELMHTFGLAHNDTDYSMMNYGAPALVRREHHPAAARRRRGAAGALSPAERRRRARWPCSTRGGRWTARSGAGAAGAAYCDPSLGDVFTTMFSAKCGTAGDDAGSTEVCAGDDPGSRYTVANFSTEEADVTARLWLSTDDRWDSWIACRPRATSST